MESIRNACSAQVAQEKSKEEIKAERETKKAEKAAKKAAAKEANASTQKKEINKPPKPVNNGKSKAELKAERRAVQEAQRAAKAGTDAGKNEGSNSIKGQSKSSSRNASQRVPNEIQADRVNIEKKIKKRLESAQIPVRPAAQRKVMLFSHLHQYEKMDLGMSIDLDNSGLHPAIYNLGLHYAKRTISGSNNRCIALLKALIIVLKEYKTPPNKDLGRDLDSRLKPYIIFLKQCRPLSVSMGNAIRFLKSKINSLSQLKLNDDEAKMYLIESMGNFIHENIILSAKQIAITAAKKIKDGSVILTYGLSPLLHFVFVQALKQSLKFKVIVADGRPRFEGRNMVKKLVDSNIPCQYIHLSMVPYIINEVSMVFYGAEAVLTNGSVMGDVGSSQMVHIAKAHNREVLVLIETYKFSGRVQTDSFVFNELGDPDDLVPNDQRKKEKTFENWLSYSQLNLLNLNFDITPPKFVDAIISELSVIPRTSVPVVLRLKSADHVGNH